MNEEKKADIKKYIAERYGHLPNPIQERLLQAYLDSAERSPTAFLEDHSIDIVTNITSTNYKDFLLKGN